MDSDDVPTLIEHALTDDRVPLTIICGFLGAGKSTLLQRILTERHGYRIAVIMNEFGDTADIEAKAINISGRGAQSEEFLELANGCLCCSIKDTGIAAIEKLMKRKSAFDYILLETTGLADPGPIASIFWQNEEFASGLGKNIYLDGVVCVIDGVFGQKFLEEDHDLGPRQIANADVILLNKVDLAPPTHTSSLSALIRHINPAAPIFLTVRGDVELHHIINIGAYRSIPPEGEPKSCERDEHAKHVHQHNDPLGISGLQISFPTLTISQLTRLEDWIRTVLWDNCLPSDTLAQTNLQVLRCKGIFTINTGERYMLQGVQNLYEMAKIEEEIKERAGVPADGKLVLIGRGLGDTVRNSLKDILL